MQILKLNFSEAMSIYDSLPTEKKIASLRPDYLKSDVVREQDCEPLYLGYNDSSGCGVYSCLIKKLETFSEKFVVQNPYGYGGELSSAQGTHNYFRSQLDLWFKSNNVLAETIARHPILSQRCDEANEQHNIYRSQPKNCVVINYNDPHWAQYTSRCRNTIRKGVNFGYKCEILPSHEYVNEFIHLYHSAMEKIGASSFYFFEQDYFEALMSSAYCTLIVCKKDEVWHSAALFMEADLYAEYHLAATIPEGRNYGATNILLDFAAHHYENKNLDLLYLGGGVTTNSDDPLLKFKTSFSNELVDYNREFRIHDQRFIEEKGYGNLSIFSSLETILL